jgi:selenocysteine lyase/cysteine desulfurase
MRKMTLDSVRQLFPVVKHRVYFNHAGTGPLPVTVQRAMIGFIRQAVNEGEVAYHEAEKVVAETRGLAARIFGVKPDEVAFVKNTSSGIIIAIGSIPWEDDDNLIMMKDAFPANSYPYQLLLPHVEKRFVSAAELAAGPECIFRLVDKNTRAVAIDWVHFLSGARFDIGTIGDFCQKNNIFFIVDAIQGLGVANEDFSRIGADFVVAGGGKWLLAPQGIGLLYVNLKKLPRLRPYNLGWLSAHWEEFNHCFTPRPIKKNASRFEEGTKNYIGIYGMGAALKLILGFGLEKVAARVRELTRQLRTGLVAAGFEIMTPEPDEQRAGIITCRKPDWDMTAVHQQLNAAGFSCALRENWLRISPHFYNTEQEVERFIQQIKIITA